MTHLAAVSALVSRSFELIDPLVSSTITTSFGPDAADAYHPRNLGSEHPEHWFSVRHWYNDGDVRYRPVSWRPRKCHPVCAWSVVKVSISSCSMLVAQISLCTRLSKSLSPTGAESGKVVPYEAASTVHSVRSLL